VLKSRNAITADFDAILALNAESVAALSPLTLERLSSLHTQAALRRVVARYDRFVYVDRIVVRRDAQRRGAGTLLYRDLFEFAAASSVDLVACEYDLDPPNLRSQRFHAKFAFAEVGRQQVAGGRKQVSLQTARVPVNAGRSGSVSG
jgi:predicted GNAT superfamily acetyltransferase